MQELTIGQIVFSKRGRDAGLPFVVFQVIGDYAYLVDGARRTMDKPKKKKQKHVQMTKHVDSTLKEKLEAHSYVNDADFRRAVLSFKNMA